MPLVLWHCWLGNSKRIWPVKIEWCGVGMVICLERGADCLHMVQLMPLPSQNPIIQTGFTFLVPVFLEKRPLNGCSVLVVVYSLHFQCILIGQWLYSKPLFYESMLVSLCTAAITITWRIVFQEWWTHLWLNEGFASWIEYLCVDHCFPEYDIWTQFATSDFTRALELDALKNSHPIEVIIIIIDNNNNRGNVYGAISLSSWTKSLWQFTRFIWWMQTECWVAANPQNKPILTGPWVRRKLAASIHFHHRGCY